MLYAAAALVAAFELAVLWQALHPSVPADYRAYFLDQTTTCLNEPEPGTYAFGTEIATVSGSEKLVKPLNICGWEGPVGDGLHAVGESSRLRFALPADAHDLKLMLQMVAVDMAKDKGEAVMVVVNGQTLRTVQVATGTPQRFDFAVPQAAIAGSKALDVELHFPEAITVDPQDSNTRKRSIKLSAVQVAEQSQMGGAAS